MQVSNALPERCASLSAFLALFLSVGCAATEEGAPPPFAFAPDHFSGSVFTGPLDREPALDAQPIFVGIAVAYLEEPPTEDVEPLSSYTRQVFVERSEEPLRTRGELARGVTVAGASGPRVSDAWNHETVEALWPGTALRCRLRQVPGFGGEVLAQWDELDLEVSRPTGSTDGVEVALAFGGPTADGTARRRERVVLDSIDLARGVRFYVPSPRADYPRSVGLLELKLADDTVADKSQAVARGEAALTAAVERVRQEEQAFDEASAFRSERTLALEALERGRLRRSALIFLASTSGARTTGELALLADEATLEEYQAEVLRHLASSDEALDRAEAFGWFLERVTYRWLAAVAATPERELPQELRSLLVRHTGELGRYPELLLEVVAASQDAQDFQRRLLVENRIFLEDSHPATRVRAFDWLEQRLLAPAGYDPLASRAERRAALTSETKEADDQG